MRVRPAARADGVAPGGRGAACTCSPGQIMHTCPRRPRRIVYAGPPGLQSAALAMRVWRRRARACGYQADGLCCLSTWWGPMRGNTVEGVFHMEGVLPGGRCPSTERTPRKRTARAVSGSGNAPCWQEVSWARGK
eukprot:scaffold74676_cov58-Phaeocystis_antarctica.AAC.4